MKKIAWVSFLLAALPLAAMAQTEDDLYYTPSQKTTEAPKATREIRISADKVEMTNTAPTTVVVRDSKGRTRNVDEYNRRYSSNDYNYSVADDTLYVDEKANSDLDGQWTGNFEGTEDDYEYAARIIRFRNPRYAIPVSSPLYWDVVYGIGWNSWDWNVYYDGWYAYAFPTFTNRLWWDWRFGPSWSWGWGGYYNNWYGGWYGGWHNWYRPYYYGGWHGGSHYAWGGGHGWRGNSNQRFAGNRGSRNFASRNSMNGNNSFNRGMGSSSRSIRGNNGLGGTRSSNRVGVGQNSTRSNSGVRSSGRVVNPRSEVGSVRTFRGNANSSVGSSRGNAGVRGESRVYNSGSSNSNGVSSSRSNRGTYSRSSEGGSYTRPSSTRSSVYSSGANRSSRSEGGYRSSSSSNRSYSAPSSNRSYNNSSSGSSRSYSAPSSSSRSSGSFGGGSSRSSGGSFGGGSRGGGGGSRGGRR